MTDKSDEEIEKWARALDAQHPEPASVGQVLALNRSLGDAVEVLAKKVSGLSAQIERLMLVPAKIAEIESRPQLRYCDTWRETENYGEGSLCTHSGGLWLAEQQTRRRPGESKSGWRLVVKSGRAT